jgi:hypothetical protein
MVLYRWQNCCPFFLNFFLRWQNCSHSSSNSCATTHADSFSPELSLTYRCRRPLLYSAWPPSAVLPSSGLDPGHRCCPCLCLGIHQRCHPHSWHLASDTAPLWLTVWRKRGRQGGRQGYRAEAGGGTGRRKQGGFRHTAAPCRRETRRGGVLMGWRNTSVLQLHSAGERKEGYKHAGGGTVSTQWRQKAGCDEPMRNWGLLDTTVLLLVRQQQGLPQAHKDGPPSAATRRCAVGRPCRPRRGRRDAPGMR